MYKITLYDNNCSPVCDGVTSFFVEQLEDFEKYWLNNENVSAGAKDRYLRSKAGEIVSDYYTEDLEYNIVQCDKNAKVLLEKGYHYDDEIFTLQNTYGCETKVYAKAADVKLRYIKFKNKYHLIGRYKLKGVCQESLWHSDEADLWESCAFYGNPVCIIKHKDVNLWIDEKGRHRNDCPKEMFKDDEIETYCWVLVKSFDREGGLDEEELKKLSGNLLAILMADIPGEAG